VNASLESVVPERNATNKDPPYQFRNASSGIFSSKNANAVNHTNHVGSNLIASFVSALPSSANMISFSPQKPLT
jgi:hypothetical protein